MTRNRIYIVGGVKHSITGSKLPSNGDVLKTLFYNLRLRRLSLHDSIVLLCEEVLIFWKKARIPHQNPDKVQIKIKNLYEAWRNLQRNRLKQSEFLKTKAAEFRDSLDDLFDVASKDALSQIKIEEDKLFLMNQRKKGRQGCMIGIDRKLAGIEKRKENRDKIMEKRRKETGTYIFSMKCDYICQKNSFFIHIQYNISESADISQPGTSGTSSQTSNFGKLFFLCHLLI